MEQFLKDTIKKFSDYLIDNCNDEIKKDLIKNSIHENLETIQIMLFISCLNKNNIDKQVDQFIQMFKINDTIEVKDTIKKYIEYFLEILIIMNS